MASWSVGKQDVTPVIRTDPGRGDDGRPQPVQEFIDAPVKATVNPIPGDVLLTLPEGERSEKNLRILTQYEFKTSDDLAGTIADHVIIRGERYEIRDVQIYEKVIPHFEYRVRRVRPQP